MRDARWCVLDGGAARRRLDGEAGRGGGRKGGQDTEEEREKGKVRGFKGEW